MKKFPINVLLLKNRISSSNKVAFTSKHEQTDPNCTKHFLNLSFLMECFCTWVFQILHYKITTKKIVASWI
jgi:hypothetical protein